MSESEEKTLKAIDVKTALSLLTLLGILATTAGAWFVQAHRVALLEKSVEKHENFLSSPRYTLEDDERRMQTFTETFTKELDRRGDWMLSHDEFRLDTVKNGAETSANIREIKNLILSIKEDVEEMKREE